MNLTTVVTLYSESPKPNAAYCRIISFPSFCKFFKKISFENTRNQVLKAQNKLLTPYVEVF